VQTGIAGSPVTAASEHQPTNQPTLTVFLAIQNVEGMIMTFLNTMSGTKGHVSTKKTNGFGCHFT